VVSPTLYTIEILGLATELANYPLVSGMVNSREMHSSVCGSKVIVGVQLGNDGALTSVGGQIRSCALGQASAAILFKNAHGKCASLIRQSYRELSDYLTGQRSELPDWQGIGTISAVRAHPGRHAAVLLPWRALLDALEKAAKLQGHSGGID
jgi:NifU-like protein involved in Fe-S cluster formation